ncbi:MAG TPA: VWA domain-containing protein [Steroidobacteraceae bacterium]|nr:VWA domain-containing protein [Steroidobacteraceae bacterium]
MLVGFFFELRESGVPVSVTEFLTLLEALRERVAWVSAQEFYYLARLCLVKDERHYDRFDRVFAETFAGAEKLFAQLVAQVPSEWLRALAARTLSEEEKRKVEALGGWDKLLETLSERLKEQKERHEGGNKWIGTGGTSPFGAYGYNPEGIRIGQQGSRNRRAVKVWDQREYRNFDDGVELGTRNMKMALRKLRKFAREGAADLLDLDGTIDATARNAGLLDLKLVPERRNAVKVLLFLDVGGSMDDHVRVCEELFSAARSEFKHLVHFYFHNFLYENVWQDNRRRHTAVTATSQVLRTYTHDYRVILVGDASMSPYEILQPGGSVEHWNKEAGAAWMQRLCNTFPRLVWLNPEPVERWEHTSSVGITRRLIGDRMFPVTLAGLDRAIEELRRPLTRAVPVGLPAPEAGPPEAPGY